MNRYVSRITRSTKLLLLRLASLSGAALLAAACASPATGPIDNPIGDFPDPFILADGGGFYAYATNANGKHVQVLHSRNLEGWRALPDAMPSLASWVMEKRPDVWAPEVIRLGDRYVLYYTARERASGSQCIGAAVAGTPTGPFIDAAPAPLVCQRDLGGTIDASPLLDGGHLYLYFKSDGNCCKKPTHIFVQELRPDGLAVTGQPTELLSNARTWEGEVVEAPTMINRDGKYFLFYSGNYYGNDKYAVAYASCDGPVGPCPVVNDQPFLQSRGDTGLIGPGHQAIFRVGRQDYIAYHGWERMPIQGDNSRRFLYIDKLDWVDGRPVVKGTSLVR